LDRTLTGNVASVDAHSQYSNAYANILLQHFAPVGYTEFYRDAILHYQHTQHCYVGYLYEVDADSYPEFQDLILPHVTSKDRQQALLLNFPSTRLTVESDSDADNSNTEPTTFLPNDILTRPLRVLVTRAERTVEETPQPPATTTSPLRSTRRKKRNRAQDTMASEAQVDKSILDNVLKLQKRMTRLCKEQKKAALQETGVLLYIHCSCVLNAS